MPIQLKLRCRQQQSFHIVKTNAFPMKKSIATTVLALTALPQLLLAHEGHGFTQGHSALHYIAEPFHALVLLTVVAGIAGLIYRFRKQSRKS
jgi:hypothetical protein